VPQTEPKFLDEAALETPALALANAARETLRIGDTVEQMLHGMLHVIRTNESARVAEVIRMDDDVDRLYTAVKLYLTKISKEALDERDSSAGPRSSRSPSTSSTWATSSSGS
jgi:phosphate:Na+ symporter